MAANFPCFKLLYLIPGKERAIRYFLNMSKATRLNLEEVKSLFKSMTYFHSVLNLTSITEGQIREYYLDAPYAKCADLNEEIIKELGNIKINPCKICEYSSSYLNAEHIKEMRIFYYLLSHPNEIENWKLLLPKKHFKSQFIYLISNINEPKMYQVSLYEKLYSLLFTYITSTPEVETCENITDIVYCVKMRFFSTNMKNLRNFADQIFQLIMTQLSEDYLKCDVPENTEQFLALLQSFPKRRKYTAKSFLPDSFKNLKFDTQMDQKELPNFLGSIPLEPVTLKWGNRSKSIAPTHSKPEILSLEELKKLADQDSKPKNPQPNESDILPLVVIDNSKLLNTNTSSLSSSINASKDIENELQEKSTVDISYSIFDEFGRINLNNEIQSCCVVPLHPHDLYSMLRLICMEQWISVDRAFDGKKDGIFIYLGSGRAAYFLELELLDSEIIKCLFFYESISILSMDGCGIFYLLLLQGVHAYPKIVSLTSKYNAAFKTDLIFPATELMELIKVKSVKFLYSPVIELVQNYNIMNLTIGEKLEENNCYKREADFLFYEFALGSSMNISKITGLKIVNLKRNTFFTNDFLYDGLFKKETAGTVCHFQFAFKKNNKLIPLDQQYKIMVYIISHIFKNRNIWNFKPLLLSYDTNHLSIFVHTTSFELLSIVEEIVCMHVAKQCKFFGMDIPHIEINT